jgi:GAF domain-containing protein
MITESEAAEILLELMTSPYDGRLFRKAAMQKLDTLPAYNWSGVYALESGVLELDEYIGAPTDHTKIEVGAGVCGTAIAEDKNQIISDVREISNYLSCSVDTRSEIVVLIKRESETLGQIDIDSHQVGAFDETDEKFLAEVAKLIAARWD